MPRVLSRIRWWSPVRAARTNARLNGSARSRPRAANRQKYCPAATTTSPSFSSRMMERPGCPQYLPGWQTRRDRRMLPSLSTPSPLTTASHCSGHPSALTGSSRPRRGRGSGRRCAGGSSTSAGSRRSQAMRPPGNSRSGSGCSTMTAHRTQPASTHSSRQPTPIRAHRSWGQRSLAGTIEGSCSKRV